jgi:hypothetical protein
MSSYPNVHSVRLTHSRRRLPGQAGGQVGSYKSRNFCKFPPRRQRAPVAAQRFEPESDGTSPRPKEGGFVLRIDAKNVLLKGNWLRRPGSNLQPSR